MTKRAERIINAFINCVKNGEYDYNYAVTLLEDNSKYGVLTESDKDVFYDAFPQIITDEATEEISGE